MQDKINAPTLKKYGFYRTPSEDFSDDGTRFLMYEYKGLQMSYAYADGDHYMSLRPDYTPDLSYSTYSLMPSYKTADEFNGVTRVDLDRLKQNAEDMVGDINLWVEDPNYFRTAKQKEEDAFRQGLEDKHMVGIEDKTLLDAVFNQAWEYGHSSGYSEVELYYIDLAQLVQTAVQVASA